MRKLLLTAIMMSSLAAIHAQVIFETPLSPRITGYDIVANLDTDEHKVTAEMDAWWVNPSENPVSDIMLHMYLNAFSNNKTCFSSNGNWSSSGDEGWGWVKIFSVEDASGNDLFGAMKFITPDENNDSDKTVLQITLTEPVKPHDTLMLHISFESKLPSPVVRTGFSEDFYFVAQWFPKFGVYETTGMRQRKAEGWNCHQFHSNSEFYSNHSVYNVSVTMPQEYVAGSGGVLVEEIINGDGTKKVVWRAEDIVDFAWTAWPGYIVVTDHWRGVEITLLTTKQARKNADKQFSAIKNALEYLDANTGPYPWPHITFVDPPLIGAGAAGMEYTTLFTSSPSEATPAFIKFPEMTTIHEFGHAYFMGILASNEFEEPWLDEGVNSYWEQRIVDHYYGDGYGMLKLPFIKMSDNDYQRTSYVSSSSRTVATNDLYSWQYPHGTYGMMSYNKASTWLSTLEGIIGTETMNNVFREYYKRWSFRHPSGSDFIGVVNDVVKAEHGNTFGDNMNWFFDQVLYGNGICDYKVLNFSNRRITGYSGIGDRDSIVSPKVDYKSDTLYKATLRLERVGDVILPVQVLVRFTNGDEIIEHWDGKERYKDFYYDGSGKIEWAQIDPDNLIDMDVNRINNSFTEKSGKLVSRRMTTKFVTLMQLLISVFTI